jgi:hypothetical protein
MRRLTLLLAAAGTALLLSAGLAFAATYDCLVGRACIGTDGPDTLVGTSGWDYMDGRQDDDELFGNERPDELSGDAWDAPVNGTSTDGDDLLRGGPGWDFMAGYGGGGELYGGLGGDFIFAEESSENRGEDTVYGNKGNDYVQARDETKDTINCGGATRTWPSSTRASTRSRTTANTRTNGPTSRSPLAQRPHPARPRRWAPRSWTPSEHASRSDHVYRLCGPGLQGGVPAFPYAPNFLERPFRNCLENTQRASFRVSWWHEMCPD